MMGESKGVVDWGVVADCLTRVVLSQDVDQFGDRRQSSKTSEYHTFTRGLKSVLGARVVKSGCVSANYNNWTL
jgi:hypothetical protein